MKSFLFFMFLMASSAYAAASPQEVVESIFKRASDIQVKNDSKLQNEINTSVDFERMGRMALGKEINKIPKAEIVWFTDTLKEIITRTVYPSAPDFLKGVKIKYGNVAQKKNTASVKSTVENKSDFTDVDYLLELQKDGAWRVVDVSLDGESWVDSIRDQVIASLKKEKWAGLKKKLSTRLAELKSEKN